MRSKIIKLLKTLEFEDYYKNEYDDCIDHYKYNYKITEILKFPNYLFIINAIQKDNSNISANYIKSELKRMELEGLIFVDGQEISYQAIDLLGTEPDCEDLKKPSEAIILTTKGKSWFKYYWYNMLENPFVVAIAIVSLLISVAQIFLD